jgi:hypothetical protein
MRKLVKIFVIAASLSALLTLGFKFLSRDEVQVLSLAIELTPTPTITPVPTKEPTQVPSPSPEPTKIPTPLPTAISTPVPTETPIPQPQYSQEQIHGFIERFSAQYGVDPNVMRHIANCESGFNAAAVNGPYTGLYQFGKTAWVSNRSIMGEDTDSALRLNAEEAAQTAAFMVSIGKGGIWPNCFP